MKEAKPMNEGELDDGTFRALTSAMREADELHQSAGGGTRHYLRECLLPALETRDLGVVRAAEWRALLELERQVRRSHRMPETGAYADCETCAALVAIDKARSGVPA